jgi:hypothetical protein
LLELASASSSAGLFVSATLPHPLSLRTADTPVSAVDRLDEITELVKNASALTSR